MSLPIIEVRNLGKKYRLGQIGAISLREEVERFFAQAGGHKSETETPGDFWALRGASFDVHPGEVLGIIGRNGAGKSTLLKVLSRITDPTEGSAVLRGRVASLLEVGTGFHPELTGRENVYLNGAILGMKRREIAARFDEIVSFAEMGKHIDTPVKRYSSGQRVRLAFAVAAHLEAEILIIDEVLAVGNARFQNRCLRKMGNLAQGGRTVLFVSHNLPLIQALCPRAILLDKGRQTADDSADTVISLYGRGIEEVEKSFTPKEMTNREHGLRFRLTGVGLEKNGTESDLIIDCTIEAGRPLEALGVGFKLLGPSGELVAAVPDSLTRFFFRAAAGRQHGRIRIPRITDRLNGGLYRLDCWLGLAQCEYLARIEEAAFFELPSPDRFGSGIGLTARRFGFPSLPVEWECREEEETPAS